MTFNNKEYQKNRRDKSQYDPRLFTEYLLSQVKNGARIRGIPCKLTYDILYSKLVESNGICALSGKQMSTMYNCPMKVSIDRIDSSKGYTKDNIQCVGGIVNKSKNEMSDTEYLELCRAVVKNAI